MKRFLVWFVLALVAIAWLRASHRSEPAPAHHRVFVHRAVGGPEGAEVHVLGDGSSILLADGRVVLEKGGRLIDIDGRGVRITDRDGTGDDRDTVVRVPAEGLPVPVVPGSRVDEARVEPPSAPAPPEPPAPPRRPRGPKAPKAPKTATRPEPPAASKAELWAVTGRLSATEDRATKDARARLERELADRLAPDVPRGWKVPARQVDRLVRQITITPVERDYGTVYQATLHVDLSPTSRARLVGAYRQEQVRNRLLTLGGLLGFVLVCLGGVSGYIRADEATKGYYTNKLRLAAAAGVGAAGVLIYQMMA